MLRLNCSKINQARRKTLSKFNSKCLRRACQGKAKVIMFGVIYKITNKFNDKIYVGQTTRTVEVRFKEHRCADSHLGNAIREYGEKNFTLEIIEECETREQLNEREIFWIAYFNCKHPNGYNHTDGGEGLIGCSDMARHHMSEAQTKRFQNPDECP